MSEVLPADLAKLFLHCFKRAAESGEPVVHEYSLPINEQTRHFEARMIRSGNEQILTMVRDITERKQAEQLLRESEERFRNLADSAPVMIWISGPDKLCNYFNKVWLDFTGRSMEQELSNGWAEGVHPADYNRCLETYVTAFNARQSFRMEYRLRRHDGEYRWIFEEGLPRYGPDHSFQGYISSAIDISHASRPRRRCMRVKGDIVMSSMLRWN